MHRANKHDVAAHGEAATGAPGDAFGAAEAACRAACCAVAGISAAGLWRRRLPAAGSLSPAGDGDNGQSHTAVGSQPDVAALRPAAASPEWTSAGPEAQRSYPMCFPVDPGV